MKARYLYVQDNESKSFSANTLKLQHLSLRLAPISNNNMQTEILNVIHVYYYLLKVIIVKDR